MCWAASSGGRLPALPASPAAVHSCGPGPLPEDLQDPPRWTPGLDSVCRVPSPGGHVLTVPIPYSAHHPVLTRPVAPHGSFWGWLCPQRPLPDHWLPRASLWFRGRRPGSRSEGGRTASCQCPSPLLPSPPTWSRGPAREQGWRIAAWGPGHETHNPDHTAAHPPPVFRGLPTWGVSPSLCVLVVKIFL